MILPQVAFQLPITIVILRPFLAAIPDELEDAASIDGASRLGFFWRILLPLSRPGAGHRRACSRSSRAGTRSCCRCSSSRRRPAHPAAGRADFSVQYTSDTAGILAFTSLAMMPALLFFTLAEKQIVGGLQGAVKG